MGRNVLGRLGFGIAMCLLFTEAAQAKFVGRIDIDGTYVEFRKLKGGTFNTPYVLYRIDQTTFSYHDQPTGDLRIEVGMYDFERIRSGLAHSNGHSITVQQTARIATSEGTKEIKVGHYMIREPDTFIYFGPAPQGQNYLLRDFKTAEMTEPKHKFKGPLFDIVQQMSQHEDVWNGLGFCSARDHTDTELTEFSQHLLAQGHIHAPLNLKSCDMVSRREYDRYSPSRYNIPEKKEKRLEHLIRQLPLVPLTEQDVRLSPDGKTQGKYHYVLFADDKKETIQRVLALFQRYAQAGRIDVKFGIINAGWDSEVEETTKYPFAIVQNDGTLRRMTEAEIIGEPWVLRSGNLRARNEASSCGGVLGATGKIQGVGSELHTEGPTISTGH